MSTPEPGVSFRELFAYSDYLAKRWLNYFRLHPEALDIDVGGKVGTIRHLVQHIFQAQQLLGDRVLQKEPAGKKFQMPTLDELSAMHQESLARLIAFASAASEEELHRVQSFGPVTASSRKILTQAALHSVHHWAQVAMEVRQAGFPMEKPQDIILSDAME